MTETYEFGKNWQRFLAEGIDQERVRIAQRHLLDLLRLGDLQGQSFLDIGCGSGIHSLAAYLAGADRVISMDVDPDSVAATRSLWQQAGSPDHWEVIERSVLDAAFMASLDKSDIVYSWGVLHHTGAMWQAIENASLPLKGNGIFYIALYAHEVYQNPSPEYWIEIKRKYNQAGPEEREEMEYWYAWERVLKSVVQKGENPFIYMRDYKRSRGMEFWTDVRDWLGGYPIEFARSRDVARFAHEQLNMDVIDIRAGEGNTEYILRRNGASNYWNAILAEYDCIEMPTSISPNEGFGYCAELPGYREIADDKENPRRSPLLVYEDGVLLGFPHAGRCAIAEKGEGRFSHWEDRLYFSASDNADPRAVGRRYELRLPKAIIR